MNRLILVILSLVSLVSCDYAKNRDEVTDPDSYSDEYTRLTMLTTPVEIEEDDALTKMDASWTNSVSFLWAATDVVGIFPAAGSQLYFSMANGVGTNTATFDGGGWALIRTAEYYSYFPFVPDFYIDKEAIPLSFIGQEQRGNADPSKAQLGEYCHQVAKGAYNSDTQSLDFTYERLGALFRFRIPIDAGTYESLSVEIEDKLIAYEGTFKAINIDGKIHDPKYTDFLELSLKDVSFEEQTTLVAFMMLPPFNILNKQLTITLVKPDGTIVKASGFGKEYLAGKGYGYAPKYSVYAKNALIDGNGGTAQVVITASGSDTYSVSTDVDWLTLETNPTSGSAVINVTAGKGLSTQRTGHIIISREETYKNTTITLRDKVEITQDLIGTQMSLGDWESSGEDYGGTAK